MAGAQCPVERIVAQFLVVSSHPRNMGKGSRDSVFWNFERPAPNLTFLLLTMSEADELASKLARRAVLNDGGEVAPVALKGSIYTLFPVCF